MTKKKISEAVSNISTRHIEEAADYSEKRQAHKPIWTKSGAIAACLAFALAIGGILSSLNGGGIVTAYAYETKEEITAAGTVIDTGTIRDHGEMTGHPLMFYLSGEDIETVRFSCKNQKINFTDWTEKRDEYGNAQNFTVTYGEDESEYYYLTIDWVPNAIIRELTDNPEAAIATLPTEMREDIIVMEITFSNGKTATKAITISLLEDGTFFAVFDDYEITAEDSFVARIDSESIPRDVLYEQGANAGQSEEEKATAIIDAPVDVTGENSLEPARAVAGAYYKNTVFEVISMELKDQTADEISFSVCVSKGGVVQDPDRAIFLQFVNGSWQVVNEGY